MRPSIILVIVAAVVESAAPRITTVSSPYGQIRAEILQLPHEAPDRSCGFAVRFDNQTGVRFDNVELHVLLSGLNESGRPSSARVTLHADGIAKYGGVMGDLLAECDDPPTLLQSVNQVKISWTSGTPDPRDAELAKAIAERRKAAAARQKFIDQLPAVDSGSPQTFLAYDRKCAEQFQQALAMEGLEKRKHIAELLSFQCGIAVPGPVHVILEKQDGLFVVAQVADGPATDKHVWFPAAWLKKKTL